MAVLLETLIRRSMSRNTQQNKIVPTWGLEFSDPRVFFTVVTTVSGINISKFGWLTASNISKRDGLF
jgi:hypothetical protein